MGQEQQAGAATEPKEAGGRRKAAKKKTAKKAPRRAKKSSTGKAKKSSTSKAKKSSTSTAKKSSTGKAKKSSTGKAKKKPAKRSRRIAGAAATKKRKTAPPKTSTGRALVVVESPAKAKTIKKYLGRGFIVKASVGHIKDLPKSKMSVDIDEGFQPHYEVIRGKRKVLKDIKDAARNVDAIYLAPDPDREGEAIAAHIYEELGKRYQPRTHRITFNEITKNAVRAAIQNPKQIDRTRYEAQQARRILDRLVGYQISPILWDKVRRGLSAGRVQSVAVRLVVDREKEIRAFVPEEYWTIECTLAGAAPPPFVAKVIKKGDEKFRPDNGDDARAAVKTLEGAEFTVAAVKRRERRRRAQAPLITSKMQQEAANRLHFTAKRTMMVAQQLYEGVELGDEGAVALITYMRTDSTRIADDALVAVREHIASQFGPDYLPAEPNTYKNRKSAQEAHEAIRPTSLEYPPEKVEHFLTKDQNKLYRLVWSMFVASQMVPAVYDQTTIDIGAAEYTLRATGSIMKFPGFLAAHALASDESRPEAGEDAGAAARDGELPALEEGQKVNCQQIVPQQHFTQPPPRFSESSLVKELEEDGIGRPSTYAAIMSTIVSRRYVTKDEGRFTPTELGGLITELLIISFPTVLDVEFTARMEESLDDVEAGKVDWVKLLNDFYFGGFEAALEKAKVEMRNVKREEIPTEHTCEKCGEGMVIKWGRNGSFVACSGYPKCRNTRDYNKRPDGTIEILPEQTTDLLCPKCEGPMVVKIGRYGQFLACKAYPDCKGTRPMSIGVDCPEGCGGYIAQRASGRGRIFYGCSSYPDCTFASWNRPVQGPCPSCGHKFLVRKYSKREGMQIKCPVKECDYQRDPELDDDDAKIAASA